MLSGTTVALDSRQSGATELGRELLAEKAEQQTHTNMRERRIVARTFIAQKRVGGS